MSEADDGQTSEADDPLMIIREQVVAGHYRVTQHAQQEMVQDDYELDDVLAALANAITLENYPLHRRGPCCLLGGVAAQGRPVHIVCTTANPMLIIITVYEPRPPKWVTPTQRGAQP